MICMDVVTNLDGLLCSRPHTTRDRARSTETTSGCHIDSEGDCSFSNSRQRQTSNDEKLNFPSYLRKTTGDHHLMELIRLANNNTNTKNDNDNKTRHRRAHIGKNVDENRKSVKKRKSATKPEMELEMKCEVQLKSTRTLPMSMKHQTIKMCHPSSSKWLLTSLMPLLIISLLLNCIAQQVSATLNLQNIEREIDSRLEARLSAVEDNFSPQRKQQQQAESSTQQKFQHVSDEQRRRISPPSLSEPNRAESSSKFSKMNELDVFLDDMNHNELRAVATGKPIGDYLFQARPLTGATGQPSRGEGGQQQQHEQRLRQALSSKSADNSSSRSSPSGTLDESQSEQQIYSECALILQRTYVKNIDNPKHQLVPFGKTEQACIGYKHIDKAVEQAKHMLKFKELTKRRKKQKPKLPALDVIHKTLEPPQDLIAAIGELNMATTQILANQFDLSNDELLNGLPLIDMSKTKFWPLCPALVRQDIKCELSRFRTLTGHCNNLKHPTWGAAMTPFARYLPPVHPDGIWIPRKSIITETVFDITPGSRSLHEHEYEAHEPSQPGPVFNDLQLPPPMPQHHDELRSMIDSAASVQFASHARPEEAELANMMQMHGHAMGPLLPSVGSPLMQNKKPTAAISGHPMSPFGMAAPSVSKPTTSSETTSTAPIVKHYHESHSPAIPFVASSFPMLDPMMKKQQIKLTTSETALQHHREGHQARSVALDLPSARLVTSVVHRDVDLPNHDLSILFMSWGQLLDHDMTRAAQSPPSIKCCTDDGRPKHKLCLPIEVPQDDPFYSKHNVQCLEFRRSLAGLRPNCVLGPRVHQNAITSPIDANFVYGSSQAQSDSLRLFRGGRLRDRDWFKSERLKPLLPAQDVDPDLECIARPKDLFCFLAGDVRVNEQTHLTVLHTIYMREHNRIADRLAHLNPHWDDERLFQETRHILAAGVQHVMINEYIPLLIGKKMADLYNLTAVSAHDHHQLHNKVAGLHWHGYDPSVTTSVANSFAAAAFRQGHTFVQGSFERFNKFHEFVSSERLRHLFKRPFLLYQPGVMDELVAGMINQASQSYDPFISEDISGHLFQPPELAFGHDLAAINLQRGREQGLPGYNLFREWCGLPRAETFDQLEPYLTNHTAFHYSRLYKHVDDIDLWSGGVSERKLPGAAIGPTFACIIARQFSNTRRGDRFWYENPGLPSSFTPDQLVEIRKRWALRLAHPVLNPRLPCDQLPQMDLRAWQEE